MTTTDSPQPTSLVQNPQFMKLWVGQTISVFGSQITTLALPLTAVLVLKASPSEMGVLNALGVVPFILLSLFAGVWADRTRRRPILMAADFGRFLLLGSIPLAALGGFLSIPYLYVVIFLIGIMTVFFDVTYQSYLPALVGREHLVEGNSKLEISNSAAAILGPGIAGMLVQTLTAPVAIIFDALSFLVSALSLRLIRAQESAPMAAHESERHVLREIREGLGVVFGNRLLWSIAACTSTANLFGSLWQAVYILYLTRALNVPPAVQGIIFAAGAPGALLAALFNAPVTKRLGLGRTIVAAIFLSNAAALLIILATSAALPSIVLMVLAGFLTSFGSVMYNVNQVSLRQAITPDRLLGRMNASMRFIVWGTIPLGSLIGGFLGDAIGLKPTIIVGTILGLSAFLWVFFSPVRRLTAVPTMAEATQAPEGEAHV
ncbi:MAG TPA: MFS transporter [Phototrophicaceae bacterium]|nr:MFS transporter [Phototrophicaceae bacterium]